MAIVERHRRSDEGGPGLGGGVSGISAESKESSDGASVPDRFSAVAAVAGRRAAKAGQGDRRFRQGRGETEPPAVRPGTDAAGAVDPAGRTDAAAVRVSAARRAVNSALSPAG